MLVYSPTVSLPVRGQRRQAGEPDLLPQEPSQQVELGPVYCLYGGLLPSPIIIAPLPAGQPGLVYSGQDCTLYTAVQYRPVIAGGPGERVSPAISCEPGGE